MAMHSSRFEKTLVILKPDAVQRRLIGRIVSRFEDKGLAIVGMKMMRITRDQAVQHYAEHKGKSFYDTLLQFITSSPALVMAVQGADAIEVCRRMMGTTFGSKAEPGTIRGDFGVCDSFNLIHGSDGAEAAKYELELYFEKDELCEFELAIEPWIYNLSNSRQEQRRVVER